MHQSPLLLHRSASARRRAGHRRRARRRVLLWSELGELAGGPASRACWRTSTPSTNFCLAEQGEQLRVVDEQVEFVLGLLDRPGGRLDLPPRLRPPAPADRLSARARSRTCCFDVVVEERGADGGAGGAGAGGVAAGAVVDRVALTGLLVGVAGDLQACGRSRRNGRARPASPARRPSRRAGLSSDFFTDWAASNSARVTIGSCAFSFTTLPLRACPR